MTLAGTEENGYRHRDRLLKELNTDVSLRVEETDSADNLKVSYRGELHLSVVENMRRRMRICSIKSRSTKKTKTEEIRTNGNRICRCTG